MKAFELGVETMARYGFTHRFEIPYTDLTSIASTSGTVDLFTYAAGVGVTKAAYRLETAFDGGATTNLALDVGHNGASTDDPDSILDNYEIHVDATEVLHGDGNGAIFATLRTGYYPLDAGVYQATFTATGANLTALTTGKVHIFLRIEDTSKLIP